MAVAGRELGAPRYLRDYECTDRLVGVITVLYAGQFSYGNVWGQINRVTSGYRWGAIWALLLAKNMWF